MPYQLLPSMPPKLSEWIGADRSQYRYFGISYCGGKATWTSGDGSGTFSFWSVYGPMIEHPAIVLSLLSSGMDVNLGSDDVLPIHMLLFDRECGTISVGLVEDVMPVLRNEQRHPPQVISAEQLHDLVRQMRSPQLGMLETFNRMRGQLDPGLAAITKELLAHLDRELIDQVDAMMLQHAALPDCLKMLGDRALYNWTQRRKAEELERQNQLED